MSELTEGTSPGPIPAGDPKAPPAPPVLCAWRGKPPCSTKMGLLLLIAMAELLQSRSPCGCWFEGTRHGFGEPGGLRLLPLCGSVSGFVSPLRFAASPAEPARQVRPGRMSG